MIDEPECPHCHSGLINRYGKAGAMQRYRYKNCTKTFDVVSKTSLARLHHKEKWLDYLQYMINGKVLRASVIDCDINLKITLKLMKPCLHAQKKEIVHLSESQEKEE